MSAFGALADVEGDFEEIVEKKKAAEAQKKAAEAQKAAATKAKFEDLKAKAGMSTWADSDDDDMFKSPAVRRRLQQRAPRPRPAACQTLS